MKKMIALMLCAAAMTLMLPSCTSDGDDVADMQSSQIQTDAQTDGQTDAETLENIKNDESIQGLWAGVIDYAPFFNGLLGDSDEKLVENVMIDMTVEIRADGTYTGGFQKESFNSAIEKIKPVLIREFTRIYSEMADRAGVDLKSFLASIGHDSVESVADAQLSFDPEKMTLEGQYLAYDGKLYVSLNTEEKPDMNSYGVYTVNGNELTMSDIVEDEDSTYGLLNAVMVPITFTRQK
ncbi:MAG: hypothetical protein IKT65_03145 [Clostridia bacterium]|nr:hypothetical protein [Clostridia bacterium]